MKTMKRWLVALLAVCLCASLMAVTVSAATGNYSGDWGDMSWSIDTEGRLWINGGGAMQPGDQDTATGTLVYPWSAYPDRVTDVWVLGPSNVPDNAFAALTGVKFVELHETLETMGSKVFCASGTRTIDRIVFDGNAPTFAADTFYGTTATCYYYVNNKSWTAEKMQNYGGTITWVPYIAYGIAGADAWWILTTDGMLTVYGSGNMVNTDMEEWTVARTPWYDYRDWITGVTVEEGIENVGKYAFSWCESLTSIKLSSTVEIISEAAFYGCPNLESVTVPGNVKYVCLNAFGYCTKLANVTLKEGVGELGWNIFSECPIESIKIPASVRVVTGQTFWMCRQLNTIEVAEGSKYFCVDENGILYNKSKTTLVRVPAMYSGCLEIPKGVKTIGRFAMSDCAGLLEVSMPDTLETIGYAAFYDCGGGNLTTFIIPDSVTYIEDQALRTGHPISYVVFGSGLEKLGRIGDIGIEKVIFKGSCPENAAENAAHGGTPFDSCWVGEAYHPKNDYSWTSSAKEGLSGWEAGGVQAWIPYGPNDHIYVEVRENFVRRDCMNYNCDLVNRCLICGDEKSRETTTVPGGYDEQYHNVVTVPAHPPTCTESGETERKYCSACGKWFAEPEMIPPLGHSYESVTTAPTCTDQGYTTYTCSVCGDNYVDDYTDTTGHTYKNGTCTVCGYEFINQQPVTQKVKNGATATLSVYTYGADPCYEWQYRPNSKSAWKYLEHREQGGNMIELTATKAMSGYQYRCKVTDDYGTVTYTRTVYLYVLGIKTQPVAKNVKAGVVAKFTVNATGHNKTYQWQYKNAKGKWVNATGTGNKTATLKVRANVAFNGRQYRCVIKDSAGNKVISNAVKLTVFGIKAQPAGRTVAKGNTARFAVTATGSGLKYQWQYLNAKGVWVNATAPGNKTRAMTVTAKAAFNGRQYRCRITDSKGRVIFSHTAKLTVK